MKDTARAREMRKYLDGGGADVRAVLRWIDENTTDATVLVITTKLLANLARDDRNAAHNATIRAAREAS